MARLPKVGLYTAVILVYIVLIGPVPVSYTHLILVPSAIIYGRVLEMTGAETVWIPGVSLCDGIAAEYAQEKKLVKLRHDFNGDILSAARNMAKRYKGHGAHIQEVDRMAAELFDVTKKYHGLGERERLLLRIAAILHDCGKFISSSRETQSSYQIIMATEIIGISHLEREIVANVVRYCNQEFAYNGVHPVSYTHLIEFGEPFIVKELSPEQRKFPGAYTRERILEMLEREQHGLTGNKEEAGQN